MIGAIILARTSSLRLPNKALLSLGKASLIEQIILQLKDIKGIEPILATSNGKEDDILIEIAKKHSIRYFRGDLRNVSQRIYDCIKQFNLTGFFRINGDSPIIDKSLLEKALTLFEKFDFITNLSPRSYPYGISVELLKADVFLEHQKEFDEEQQEHVTKYFYKNKECLKIVNLTSEKIYNSDMILTIDDMETYQKFWELFNQHPNISSLNTQEIVTLINKSE